MGQATPEPENAGGSGPPPGGQQGRPLVFGPDVPFPNPNFTGRDAELAALHAQLGSGTFLAVSQPPSVLHGMGGVGKTQIAAEYVHRNAGDYEAVWWVRAHDQTTIWQSLEALGRHLDLPEISPQDPGRSRRAVIDALQSGKPYSRWLLVFDDVTKPEELRQFIPRGTGHVIVTSRISEWWQILNTPGIEVKVFARPDTLKFLRARVPELCAVPDAEDDASRHAEANRLADVLGDLPLAAQHAASYLSQIRTPVTDYIEAFDRDPQAVLGQHVDMINDKVIEQTWNLTRQKLSPEAEYLFTLLAFFAPQPIAEEILLRPGWTPADPDLLSALQTVLTSREVLNTTERDLVRLSLISFHGQGHDVELHRVVQGVTRARTEKDNPELAEALKETVLGLLAATDPGAPESEQNDVIYDWSIEHLRPAGALESGDTPVRNLVVNQVCRLRMHGAYQEALSLGEAALEVWKSDPYNTETLAMSVEVAIAMRMLGRTAEAFTLNGDTLKRLYESRGDTDATYLTCASSYGEDLRLLGRYEEALAHDSSLVPNYAQVFTPNEFRTLSLRNNMALDMRCVGQYEEALSFDTDIARQREQRFGPGDWQTLSSMFGLSSDLRRLGQYEKALEIADAAAAIVEAPGARMSFLRLSILSGQSVSLRRTGRYRDAHRVAGDVHRRCVEYAGAQHRATLVLATNLICDRRLVDDLAGAQELGEATVAAWDKAVGADHPNALIARANLAVVLRARGRLVDAQAMNTAALDGLRIAFSGVHPYQLIVMTNLASDLAAVGEVERARQLGEEAAGQSRTMRGDAHPVTLAASANLALDRRAVGDVDKALELETETLAALERQLPAEHPQAIIARQRGRLNLDIEPTTLF
jgi:tetratricopeptide (TPR) repeat protein